jgi:hypothetical protein
MNSHLHILFETTKPFDYEPFNDSRNFIYTNN